MARAFFLSVSLKKVMMEVVEMKKGEMEMENRRTL